MNQNPMEIFLAFVIGMLLLFILIKLLYVPIRMAITNADNTIIKSRLRKKIPSHGTIYVRDGFFMFQKSGFSVEIFPIPVAVEELIAPNHGAALDQIVRQLHQRGGDLQTLHVKFRQGFLAAPGT